MALQMFLRKRNECPVRLASKRINQKLWVPASGASGFCDSWARTY